VKPRANRVDLAVAESAHGLPASGAAVIVPPGVHGHRRAMAAGGTIRAGKRSAPKSIRGRKFVDDEYATYSPLLSPVLVLTVVGNSDDKVDAAQVKKTMLFNPSEGWVTEPILDGCDILAFDGLFHLTLVSAAPTQPPFRRLEDDRNVPHFERHFAKSAIWMYVAVDQNFGPLVLSALKPSDKEKHAEIKVLLHHSHVRSLSLSCISCSHFRSCRVTSSSLRPTNARLYRSCSSFSANSTPLSHRRCNSGRIRTRSS
jgi:hypothetical protein